MRSAMSRKSSSKITAVAWSRRRSPRCFDRSAAPRGEGWGSACINAERFFRPTTARWRSRANKEWGRGSSSVCMQSEDKERDMAKAGLLIVDDDAEIRDQLRWALEDTYAVQLAGTTREALAYIKRERPPLVTLDLGLPPHPDDATEGLALLDAILAIDQLTKVIVLTGNSDRANALSAIQRGAYDFVQKPVHLETLKLILERANYVHQLEHENRR